MTTLVILHAYSNFSLKIVVHKIKLIPVRHKTKPKTFTDRGRRIECDDNSSHELQLDELKRQNDH